MKTQSKFKGPGFVLLMLLYGGAVVAEIEEVTPPQPDSREVETYRELVREIESKYGAYGTPLSEHLLSLGRALQRDNRHIEAVTVFKRGIHLSRINEGLYSGQQIPLISGEIASHVALGQLSEADDRQKYLYSVQIRTLDSGDIRAQALMQQADWQLDAYQLGLGANNFSRLMNMWDLYRLALTDIVEREGETSLSLLTPLYGMLQAQYLISGYQATSSSTPDGDSDYATRRRYNQFNAYRAQSYKKGSAVIRAIYEIEQDAGSPIAAADALAQLGDWYQWHGEDEQASQAYRDAIAELVEMDDAQAYIDELFSEPHALPDLDEVRPLPRQVSLEDGNVVLQFNVTSRGRVIDLERLDTTEGIDGKVNRLMRQLRKTPFRPRLEGGEPVAAEKVMRIYAINDN
jgi:hypothetical protein